MFYYKRHIGDYNKKAARLSMLQHGAYTILIDSCYDREKFPTEEEAIDWCWASTDDEIAAVRFVLRKFFTLEDGVYVQNRIKEEIEKYHKNAETNKRIAMEREAKRKENSTKRERSVNEPPPNQEPLTINQEPLTKNQNKNKSRPKDAQEVTEYAKTIGYSLDGQKFIDHYEANGWMRGKNKIKDWKACVRTWKQNEEEKAGKTATANQPPKQRYLN